MGRMRVQPLTLVAAGLLVVRGQTGVSRGLSGLRTTQASCVPASVPVFGQTTLADRPNGVSGTIAAPPRLRVNLSRPVPGGGGRPLGIIVDTNTTPAKEFGLLTEWKTVRDTVPGLLDIPVGKTVPIEQLNVLFHIDGRFHILQMGPQPFGHCHGATRVHGKGTSRATIFRPSPMRWVMDLPPGSTGRLFDVSHSAAEAVDRGTYSLDLHYELIAPVLPLGKLCTGDCA